MPTISKPDSMGVKITLVTQHMAQHEMLPKQHAQPALVSLETMLFSDFEIFQSINFQNKYFFYTEQIILKNLFSIPSLFQQQEQ